MNLLEQDLEWLRSIDPRLAENVENGNYQKMLDKQAAEEEAEKQWKLSTAHMTFEEKFLLVDPRLEAYFNSEEYKQKKEEESTLNKDYHAYPESTLFITTRSQDEILESSFSTFDSTGLQPDPGSLEWEMDLLRY